MTLRHRLASVGLLVCVASVVGHGQTPPVFMPRELPEPRPTFRARAEAVAIDVFVTDADGNAVSGLTADDFELDENGKRQDITTFRAVNIPVEVRDEERPLAEPDVASNEQTEGRVYVIADGLSSPEHALKARLFLRKFLDKHFAPNDVAAVVNLGRGLATDGQDFTSNRRLLLAAIDKFGDGGSGGSRDATNALRDVVAVLGRMPGRHKSLIYLSPSPSYPWADLIDYVGGGVGNLTFGYEGSRPKPGPNSLIFDDAHGAMSVATRNNITIYPIDPEGLSLDTMGQFARMDFRALAEITGGFAHVNTNDFEGTFERIVRDASTYYMLGFNSDYRKNDGKFVRLNVRVKRPGLTVRTRSGYVSAFRHEREAAARFAVRAGDVPPISVALGNPVAESGHPIRVTAAAYKATGDLATVVISIETSLVLQESRQQKPNVRNGQLKVHLLTTDASRRIYPELRHQDSLTLPTQVAENTGNRVRLVTEMALPKGRYQIRIASGSDRVAGNVLYELEVPDFTSTPLMLGGLSLAADRNTMPTVHAANNKKAKTKKCYEPSCVSVDVRDVPVTPWSEKTLTAQHPLYAALPTPPTTVRQFRQADTITVFTEVYDNDKTARPISVRAKLRQPNQPAALELSQELDTGKPRASGGHAVAFTLPLAGVRPGRYVLRLEASASEEDRAMREVPVDVLEP